MSEAQKFIEQKQDEVENLFPAWHIEKLASVLEDYHKTQLKKLYEDAVYLHLIHCGRRVSENSVRIIWNDEEL